MFVWAGGGVENTLQVIQRSHIHTVSTGLVMGAQPREEQASMAKHPPFDAVPALSYGAWV